MPARTHALGAALKRAAPSSLQTAGLLPRAAPAAAPIVAPVVPSSAASPAALATSHSAWHPGGKETAAGLRAARVVSRSLWRLRPQNRGVWKPWKRAQEDELTEGCHIQAPQHRPVLKIDLDRCIHVGGMRLSEQPLRAFGLRVQDNFCTELQSHMALMEVHELLVKYGYSLPDDQAPIYTMSSLREVNPISRNKEAHIVRCSGRRTSHYHPERSGDQVAPWGYGEDFDVTKVPPKLRSMLEMIQKSPLFSIGKPRSLSINKRRNSFFKLDPHINDHADGENIFIVNLCSNVVYTFTPPGDFQRNDPIQYATRSWSDKDIDVLLRHRSLLLMSGSSRREWRHAVRAGMQVQLSDGDEAICDWWGTTRNLVRRSSEKVAIVFGFDKTESELQAEAEQKQRHSADGSIGRW